MKIVFRLVVWAVVLIGGANYYTYIKTGRMPVRDWITNMQSGDPVQQLKTAVVQETQPSAGPVKVYKWKDANGVVHYDNKPVNGAQVVEVDPNVNSMPAPPVQPKPEAKRQTSEEQVRQLQEAKQARMDALTQ